MIRALPCTESVITPAWLPVNDRASSPRLAIAMANSAMEMRSPAVSSMSSSRPGGSGLTCSASSSSSSVVSPMADTTTTTSLPALRVSTMRAATRRIRSASAREDPPYFCTTSGTACAPIRWTPPGSLPTATDSLRRCRVGATLGGEPATGWRSQPVGLEQPQPNLAHRRKRRYGVPKPVQRYLAHHGNRRRVQQLGQPRAGEGGTDQHPALVVHDELAGTSDAGPEGGRASDRAGVHGDHPDRQAPLARLRLGEPDRAHLWVGERHPRHHVDAGAVDRVSAEDDVSGDPSLVLAHVCQQRPAVAVPDRIQPVAVHPGDLQPVVGRHRSTRLQADGFQPDVGRPGPAPDGDQDLVRVDLSVVGQGRRHRSVRAVPPYGGQRDARGHRDALGLEGPAYLLAGEGLLPSKQPRAALDDGDLARAEPAAEA